MNNSVSDTQSTEQHAKEVEYTRHHHSKLGTHGTRIDDRRNCVGRVVETVDRFVKQYKQQGKNQ